MRNMERADRRNRLRLAGFRGGNDGGWRRRGAARWPATSAANIGETGHDIVPERRAKPDQEAAEKQIEPNGEDRRIFEHDVLVSLFALCDPGRRGFAGRSAPTKPHQ